MVAHPRRSSKSQRNSPRIGPIHPCKSEIEKAIIHQDEDEEVKRSGVWIKNQLGTRVSRNQQAKTGEQRVFPFNIR